MPDKEPNSTKKHSSPDWFVRGILTKIGDIFDRLTGRGWKPSSSLATSELVEKLKKLLDDEARDMDGNGKFVPHNIKLKMQWDKFSTDAEKALKNLEHELLTAAIDHINDCRYHTYAPMQLEIKPDYFTEGIKLSASFDKFSETEQEAAVNVSVPDLKNVVINPIAEVPPEPEKEIYIAEFSAQDKLKKVELAFADRQRLSVGRTKENDLQVDDVSVSKIHAALVLNSDKHLMVADTGSTNGTFINDQRIAYGKAILIKETDKLRFGTVNIALTRVVREVAEIEKPDTKTVSTNGNQTIIISPLVGEKSAANNTPIAAPTETGEAETKALAGEEIAVPTEAGIKLDFGENK